jgi:hypothetical protein
MTVPRVYTGNHTGPAFWHLNRIVPGRVGLLYSAGYWKDPRGVPYLVDNGIYARFLKGLDIDWQAFERTLGKAAACKTAPEWVAVPYAVGDLATTAARWKKHAPELRERYGFPLCYVAQNGATAADVPHDADFVAIGGTTEWKWGRIAAGSGEATIRHFTSRGLRVHVLRVNTGPQLHVCALAGVESVDGSGWFRKGDGTLKGNKQLRQLRAAFGIHDHPTPEILAA